MGETPRGRDPAVVRDERQGAARKASQWNAHQHSMTKYVMLYTEQKRMIAQCKTNVSEF